MVDNGIAPKHEVRSLIAFIAREVAVLEAAYARAVEDHFNLKETQTKAEADHSKAMSDLQQENSNLKTKIEQDAQATFSRLHREQREFRRRSELRH